MHKILLALLLLFSGACSEKPHFTVLNVQPLALDATGAELSCRYHKKISAGKEINEGDWFFWRQSHRTETRDELSRQGEIWERQKPGHYFYTRLFFNENVALEFTPGDLAATHSAPSEPLLSTLVNPATFGKALVSSGSYESGGLTVESYQGRINGIETEIDWLPKLQLPARIKKTRPDHGIDELTLDTCGKFSDFKIKPAALDNFRRLDYTDLGDMESDPVVHRIEQHLHGQHAD